MKAIELKKDSIVCGAYCVHGDDPYWIDYTSNMFASLIPEEQRSFNLKVLDSLSSVQDIVDATATLSFFGGDTVIIVKDSAYKEKAADKNVLLSIVNGDLSNIYLLLCGDNLLTSPQLKKAFVQIEANKLDVFALSRELTRLAAPCQIQSDASSLLIEYTGRNMLKIANELAKLKAYRGGKTITADDVRALVADDTENEIYEFSGALAQQNRTLAYNILNRFIAKNVSYAYMLGALSGQFRRMLYASLSKLSDAELADTLKVKEYAIKKARETARKYTTARLKKCMDTLINAEFSFKSGETGEETAFKTAVSKLIINF